MEMKDLLYEEINRMGTNFILEKLRESRENSTNIIDQLLNNCYHNRYGKFLTVSDHLSLSEALTHYMLTTMMLPSQRKIRLGGIEISLILPDSRNLKKSPNQTLIIQFLPDEKISLENMVTLISKLQPNSENIWFVSYSPIRLPDRMKNYVISNSHNKDYHDCIRFSRILFDAAAFVDLVKDFHFRVF